jgi:hypothetical protein
VDVDEGTGDREPDDEDHAGRRPADPAAPRHHGRDPSRTRAHPNGRFIARARPQRPSLLAWRHGIGAGAQVRIGGRRIRRPQRGRRPLAQGVPEATVVSRRAAGESENASRLSIGLVDKTAPAVAVTARWKSSSPAACFVAGWVAAARSDRPWCSVTGSGASARLFAVRDVGRTRTSAASRGPCRGFRPAGYCPALGRSGAETGGVPDA